MIAAILREFLETSQSTTSRFKHISVNTLIYMLSLSAQLLI